MARRKNFNKDLTTLFYINLTALVLILSAFNLINSKKKQIQVLGAQSDNSFWEEFVIKHPTYRDAWIELGRIDKAKEIDPNYNSQD